MADTGVDIAIRVNGTTRRLRKLPSDLTMLELLHEFLGLTGTKFGCGIGECGACTIAVRSAGASAYQALRACSVTAAALSGCQIVTVEGLGLNSELSPLQQQFLESFAFQCGYCTPGFLMAAFVLIDRLQRAPVAEEDFDGEIVRACGDHICRCTGYRRYYEAIRAVILAQPGLVAMTQHAPRSTDPLEK